MIAAQFFALTIIAVSGLLIGVGVLRGVVAFDRYLRAKNEAEFRAAVLVASSCAEIARLKQSRSPHSLGRAA